MARSFDAEGEALYVGSAVLSALPISMACWFNVDNITGRNTLMTIDYSVTGNYRHLRMVANGFVASDPLQAIQLGATASTNANAYSYSANVWQHGCAVFTSTTRRDIYLNGGTTGGNTNNSGAITPLDRTLIAAWGFTAGGYNNTAIGSIAEAAIWDIALSSTDALLLSKGVSPLMVQPQNLVLYMPLVRDNDTDLIGGLTMTAVGTPGIADHPSIFYPRTIFTGGLPTANPPVPQYGPPAQVIIY